MVREKDRLLKAAYLRFRELVVNTVTEIELIVNHESGDGNGCSRSACLPLRKQDQHISKLLYITM